MLRTLNHPDGSMSKKRVTASESQAAHVIAYNGFVGEWNPRTKEFLCASRDGTVSAVFRQVPAKWLVSTRIPYPGYRQRSHKGYHERRRAVRRLYWRLAVSGEFRQSTKPARRFRTHYLFEGKWKRRTYPVKGMNPWWWGMVP